MDRLHSMRVFARVIDEGSFAAAARELNVSPAVVTRLVADLEEHLGARLINRTTRRLSLTDTGELYLERLLSATPEQLGEVMHRYLDADNVGVLVYRPNGTPAVAPSANDMRRLLNDGHPEELSASPPFVPGAPAVTYAAPRFEREEAGVRVYRTDGDVPILVRRKPGAPLLHAGLFVLGGASDEREMEAGLTTLMVRTAVKGTQRRSALQIAEEGELLGGSVSGSVAGDSFGWSISVPSRYAPAPSLVCLENTHNGAGGKITAIEEMRKLSAVAREHRLPVHLDGARLWNASIASGTSLAEFASCADTVMVDFSKGLGAPIGAALATSASLADEAWVVRKRFGGAMRQSGILAAAALHALDHQLERLAEDHARARMLAQMVDGVRGARVVPPDTNIVMIDLPSGLTSAAVAAAAKECGVLLSTWAPTRIRCVTQLVISASTRIR